VKEFLDCRAPGTCGGADARNRPAMALYEEGLTVVLDGIEQLGEAARGFCRRQLAHQKSDYQINPRGSVPTSCRSAHQVAYTSERDDETRPAR
jgi:hypothetical protein